MFSLEDDAAGAVGVGHDTIADFEACGAQRVGRDRDLMFGTDPCRSAATVLYFSHECKGTVLMGIPQPVVVHCSPLSDAARRLGSGQGLGRVTVVRCVTRMFVSMNAVIGGRSHEQNVSCGRRRPMRRCLGLREPYGCRHV